MQQVLTERLLPRSRSSALAEVTLILLASLFIAVFAQINIPLQPVPLTGQTFAVLLVGMALGSRRGALALAAYLAEGAAGLPVFAEAKSGLAVLFGPTGGYLFGFVAAAWLVGWLAERGWDRSLLKTLAAMVLGNAVIYLLGVSWLIRFVGSLAGESGALALGLYPFLLGDAIKAVAAALFLPSAWRFIDGPQDSPVTNGVKRPIVPKAALSFDKCQYCGRRNRKEVETCTGCGASLPN